MKYLLIIVLFSACHQPDTRIFYSAQQICLEEMEGKLDSLARLSPMIDSFIAKRGRARNVNEYRQMEDSVQHYIKRVREICGPTERDYLDVMTQWYKRKRL